MADRKKQTASKRRKKRMTRFHMAIVLFIAIVVVSGALAILLVLRPGSAEDSADKPAVFGVHEVTVTGTTRYDPEAIIGISGIRVGQSLFSVNKIKANDAIMANFPYIERVEVGNASFDTVEIRVWEVEPIGAMYADGQWLVVGSNNKGVEAFPLQGDRPNRYLYFKGAEPADGTLGGKAMSDRSFRIVTTLIAAMEKHGLEGVGEIDLSEMTNIKLNWKNQITILLGNETNLEDEVAFLVSVLPELLKNNGATAKGVFDLRSYSDDNKDNDRGIFTPADVLAAQEAAAGAAGDSTEESGDGSGDGATEEPGEKPAEAGAEQTAE